MSEFDSKGLIESDFSMGVFAGPNALDQYRNPYNHRPTDLIELSDPRLNRHRPYGVRKFVKDGRIPPSGQVKSLPVYEMSQDANLPPGIRKYEASSGNTVAAIAPGEDLTAYVNHGTAVLKIQILRLLGAEVVETTGGAQRAREEGQKEGSHNLDQYRNPANSRSFYKKLGPEIRQQTEPLGGITLFCAGLGSTATMVGTGGFLKEQNPAIQTVGVIVKEGEEVPGVRTLKRLEETALGWEQVVDHRQFVGTKDSYRRSLELARIASILAGPSTGFALQGLNQQIDQMIQNGTLDSVRNQNGEVIAVIIAPDSLHLYLPEFFEVLGENLDG